MYAKLLSEVGDKFEQRGVKEFGLGEKFPRYAEFWARYVLPNRDRADTSKLRRGFPTRLEDIVNNHYSVFYHLTYAYVQITFLSGVPDETNTVLDIGDPLYHLATTAELTERTLVGVFLESKTISITDLTKEISDNYKESLVAMSSHDVRKLFNMPVLKSRSRKNFNKVAETIRRYRNKLIHGAPPLTLYMNGKICIPKAKYLEQFVNGRWSSNRNKILPNRYAPAVVIIQELADALVKALNDLWEILIKEGGKIIPVPTDEVSSTKDIYTILPFLLNAGMAQASGMIVPQTPNYSGGSAIFTPPDHKPESDRDPF